MSPVRTVYVPRFNSQLGSSQRDEQQPDETDPPSHRQRDKRGNKRCNVRGEKTRPLLKVKLPKLHNRTLSTKLLKDDNTRRRWMLEPAANKTKTTESPGGETQSAGTDSDSIGGDVFFFSRRATNTPINGKEKVKPAVLRTISKMLEENQLIRQRLTVLSHAS